MYSKQRDCVSKGMLCHVQENANISSLLGLWSMRVQMGNEEEEKKLERKARPDDGGP